MTRNNDDLSNNNNEVPPRYDADPIGNNQRREPKFSSFDEDDEDSYEEPDRDTDYTSGYRADGVEDEEEFEDELPDDDEQDQFLAEDSDPPYESDPSVAEEPDTWLEKEGYLDEDEDSGQNWPLSLIAVAVVALVLLIGGGYGVMQQRAATEEEIRQLRAALATTASPEDVSASRTALQEMKQSYDELSAIAEAMTLENRRLADTVAGLEAQLGVQQAVLTKTPPEANQVKPASVGATSPQPMTPQSAAPKPATPTPVAPQPAIAKLAPAEAAAPKPVASSSATPATAAPEPVATPSVVATPSGPWFVNFGSYASPNMAETWASRLHPGMGKVIVMPNTKDGQTLYRVRVVGLANRGSAQEVAHKLEAELRVSELWVGKE